MRIFKAIFTFFRKVFMKYKVHKEIDRSVKSSPRYKPGAWYKQEMKMRARARFLKDKRQAEIEKIRNGFGGSYRPGTKIRMSDRTYIVGRHGEYIRMQFAA